MKITMTAAALKVALDYYLTDVVCQGYVEVRAPVVAHATYVDGLPVLQTIEFEVQQDLDVEILVTEDEAPEPKEAAP